MGVEKRKNAMGEAFQRARRAPRIMKREKTDTWEEGLYDGKTDTYTEVTHINPQHGLSEFEG